MNGIARLEKQRTKSFECILMSVVEPRSRLMSFCKVGQLGMRRDEEMKRRLECLWVLSLFEGRHSYLYREYRALPASR